MRVQLIEPPARYPGCDVDQRTPERLFGCAFELYHMPDLAQLQLLSIVRQAGHEIDFLDATLEQLDAATFEERVAAFAPDALVLHGVLLSKPVDCYWIARLLDLAPATQIFVYGPEPTRVPEQFLLDQRVIVLRGEADLSLPALLAGEVHQGVSRLVNGAPEHVPSEGRIVDFESLPAPDWDIEPLRRLRHKLRNPKFRVPPQANLLLSRGCAYRCLFCVPISLSFAREQEHLKNAVRKPPVSMLSAATAIERFKQLAQWGYRSVMVVDDQFLWAQPRTLEICEGIADLKLSWGCLSRADFLQDLQVAQALADAGCESIDIGVESLSQDTLDYVRKDLKVEQVHTAVHNLRSAGIRPKINIVIGASPFETEARIIDSVRQLQKMGASEVMFSIATPFKGTEFYRLCREQGYLKDQGEAINPMGKAMIGYPPPGLSAEGLEAASKRAYRAFYLSPRFIFNRLKSVRSPADLLADVKTALRILR
ncbi:MAG: radical SAM protein [Candidatus Alcyoniella australis]|nr:radical SAM protein [Candidatus Alcyoniella australis]